jgi:hypothetical protein
VGQAAVPPVATAKRSVRTQEILSPPIGISICSTYSRTATIPYQGKKDWVPYERAVIPLPQILKTTVFQQNHPGVDALVVENNWESGHNLPGGVAGFHTSASGVVFSRFSPPDLTACPCADRCSEAAVTSQF